MIRKALNEVICYRHIDGFLSYPPAPLLQAEVMSTVTELKIKLNRKPIM